MELRSVYVRKKGDKSYAYYVCRPSHLGWHCGKCLRGNLGLLPKKRRQCKVCKARVVQVVEQGKCDPIMPRAPWEPSW
jgi:hypothetical protein